MPAKVEDFKLTDSQRSFAGQYKQLKQVEALLQGETLKQQAKSRSLSALWRELNRRFMALTPPETPTHELSGQEEEEGQPEQGSELPSHPPGADWNLRY